MLNNPYASPHAAVGDVVSSDGLYQPRVFALNGRLGRIRYLAYMSVSWIVSAVIIGITSAALIPSSVGARGASTLSLLMFVLYLPLMVFGFVLAKRRFNDVDRSGWWSVLLMVPFLNFFVSLYLMFAGGTEGDNDYGPPTVPNTTWLTILGVITPVLFIIAMIGILAAVAIPAYSQYQAKARAANGQLPAPSEQR